MAYQQDHFYNPRIPFIGSIHGGLQVGKTITIKGRVLPNATSFNVNLQCASKSKIALHFNPRYENGPPRIVTNTFQNSCWGNEEIINQALFPPENNFTLRILVNQDSYKINVNENDIKDYNHRIAFDMVDTILVDGMVQVYSIAFQNPAGANPIQEGFKAHYAYPVGFEKPVSAADNFRVPYKTSIDGGLHSGKTIYIQGVVTHKASSFEFNLRHESGIAFHYKPHFNENIVVCNTQTGDKWGEEEKSESIPFNSEQPFQVAITCEPSGFNVFVNGKQSNTYNHRFTNLAEIKVLEIAGDLNLDSVVM